MIAKLNEVNVEKHIFLISFRGRSFMTSATLDERKNEVNGSNHEMNTGCPAKH